MKITVLIILQIWILIFHTVNGFSFNNETECPIFNSSGFNAELILKYSRKENGILSYQCNQNFSFINPGLYANYTFISECKSYSNLLSEHTMYWYPSPVPCFRIVCDKIFTSPNHSTAIFSSPKYEYYAGIANGFLMADFGYYFEDDSGRVKLGGNFSCVQNGSLPFAY